MTLKHQRISCHSGIRGKHMGIHSIRGGHIHGHIHNHGGQDHIHIHRHHSEHQHRLQHQQISCHSDIHGKHMGIHSIHGGHIPDHIHNLGGQDHVDHIHRHHSMRQHQLQQLELQQQQQKGKEQQRPETKDELMFVHKVL